MPKIVGDYKIIKTIGRGTFSIVKKVLNIRNNIEYAMKIIPLSSIRSNKQFDKIIKHRINLISKMNHPGIVSLHGIMHSTNNLFLIFDLAKGEFLSSISESCPLPEATARKYFQQLIDALSYMHDHDITFRDLKLENLLIDSNNNLKIADFIFSNFHDAIIEDIDLLESDNEDSAPNSEVKFPTTTLRYYAAPEVLHEQGYVSPACDIWSAGVILYVMLTGTLPFDGETPQILEEAIKDPHVSYPSSIPTKVVNFLKWMINPDPAKRITIKEIRNNEWFKQDYTPILGQEPDPKHVLDDIEVTVHLSADTTSKKVEDDVNDSVSVFELIAKTSPVSINTDTKPKDDTQKSPTTFSSPMPISKAVEIVNQTLKDLGAHLKNSKSERIIKAIIPICSKEVYIRLSLSKISSDLSLIEIERLQGGQMDFLRVYKIFKSNLA